MPASVFLWICPPWDKFCLGQSLLNFLDLNQCIHQFVKFLHILSSSISIRAFSFPFLLDIQLSVYCRGSSCPQFLTFLCYLSNFFLCFQLPSTDGTLSWKILFSAISRLVFRKSNELFISGILLSPSLLVCSPSAYGVSLAAQRSGASQSHKASALTSHLQLGEVQRTVLGHYNETSSSSVSLCVSFMKKRDNTGSVLCLTPAILITSYMN